MKKTTTKKVIDLLIKFPKMLKMLPILFPKKFSKIGDHGIIVSGDMNEPLEMNHTLLGHYLKTFKEQKEEYSFILNIFEMGSLEAALLAMPIPNFIQGTMNFGREGHKAHYMSFDLGTSIIPDFSFINELTIKGEQWFCEIGQLFMRKSYPKNLYAPVKKDGKVRMLNITHSVTWNDPKFIRFSDLKDVWQQKRLTVDEFKLLTNITGLDDFIKVDLTMDKDHSVKAQAYIWQSETKAAWNKR